MLPDPTNTRPTPEIDAPLKKHLLTELQRLERQIEADNRELDHCRTLYNAASNALCAHESQRGHLLTYLESVGVHVRVATDQPYIDVAA